MSILSQIVSELYLSSAHIAGKQLALEITNEAPLKAVVASLRDRNTYRSLSSLRSDVRNTNVQTQQVLYIESHLYLGEYDAFLGGQPYAIIPEVRDYSYAGGMTSFGALNSIHEATRKATQSAIKLDVTYNNADSLSKYCDHVTLTLLNDLYSANMLNGYDQIIVSLSTDLNFYDVIFSTLPVYVVTNAGYKNQIEKMVLAANVGTNDYLVSVLSNDVSRMVTKCGEFSPCLIKGISSFETTEIFFPSYDEKPILIKQNQGRENNEDYTLLMTGVFEVLLMRSRSKHQMFRPVEIKALFSKFKHQLFEAKKEAELVYLQGF